MSIDGAEEDDALAGAEFLSREEVLRRRSRRLKQLNRCYRKHYWALMEEIRAKHRDYYWEFGKSPVEEDNATTGDAGFGHAEGENGSSSRGERKRCAYIGCKSKAMPLTNYCHPHIIFDTKQTLYKACNHVIKRYTSCLFDFFFILLFIFLSFFFCDGNNHVVGTLLWFASM